MIDQKEKEKESGITKQIEAFLNKASVFEKMRKFKDAEDSYNSAIKRIEEIAHLDGLNAICARLFSAYSEFLKKQNRQDEARVNLEIAIEFGYQAGSSSSSPVVVSQPQQSLSTSNSNNTPCSSSSSSSTVASQPPPSSTSSVSLQLPAQPLPSLTFQDLNAKILTKDGDTIQALAERLSKNPSPVNELFGFIERSKGDPQAAIAAANAITILNAANVNLSGRDFRGVRIPEADLSYGIITNTNFSSADLRNVQFNEAILDYSIFDRSNLEGIELGQKSFELADNNAAFAICPDAKLIAFTKQDNTLSLRNFQTGSELHSLQGHTSQANNVIFSPDGKTILSGSQDGTVRLWDCQTGRKLLTVKASDNPANTIAFSPDGNSFIAGGQSIFRLWDSQTGQELQTFCDTGGQIRKIAFSPDGKTILSSGPGKVCLWERETGKQICSFSVNNDEVASFSNDSKRVFSYSLSSSLVRIWDSQTGKSNRFNGVNSNANCLAFSPDPENKWVVTGHKDSTISLWDCQTGTKRHTFLGHGQEVTSVAFSPDGKWVLSGSNDGTVRLWDCRTAEELHSFGHMYNVKSVGFTSNGKWAFLRGDGILQMWNLNRPRFHRTKNSGFDSSRICISTDGRSTLSVFKNSDGNASWNLMDCQTGTFKQLPALQYLINNRSGPHAHSTGSNWVIFDDYLYDTQTGAQQNGGQKLSFKAVTFSPYGNQAFSGSSDGTLCVWDLPSCKKVKTLGDGWLTDTGHSGDVTCLACSLDGKYLLSAGKDKTVRLWDCTNGKRLQCFGPLNYNESVTHLAISPDGAEALIANSKNDIHLFDCKTGNLLHTLTLDKGSVNTLGFYPIKLSPNWESWAFFAECADTVNFWERKKKNSYPTPNSYSPNTLILHHRLSFDKEKKVKLLNDGSILVSTQKSAGQSEQELWSLFSPIDNAIQPMLKWRVGNSVLSKRSSRNFGERFERSHYLQKLEYNLQLPFFYHVFKVI